MNVEKLKIYISITIKTVNGRICSNNKRNFFDNISISL